MINDIIAIICYAVMIYTGFRIAGWVANKETW